MATSEGNIRKAVAVLLNQYGSLTTDEVKKLLNQVIHFDADDLQPSNSRPNEIAIIQRIGNVVSHQKENVKFYLDSYAIDKTSQPATWYALSGLKTNGTLKKVDAKRIKKLRALRERYIPKKVDWNNLNSSRSELGYKGECFAVGYETKKILSFAEDDADRIIHLSEEQGDGAGFDIISLNRDGTSKYIEVKTTIGSLDTPFYMSDNERNFFKLHKDSKDAYIYRVYNFNTRTNTGEVEKISATSLFNDYEFNPVSYRVTKK